MPKSPESHLRLEYVDPATLGANPANWRRHPESQREAVKAAIDRAGWARPLLFNETTGRLIDGHLRRDMYAGTAVPVLIGAWPADQESLLLATLDPLSSPAEVDPIAFDGLLRQLDVSSPELLDLLGSIATDAGMYELGDDDENDAPKPKKAKSRAKLQADEDEEGEGEGEEGEIEAPGGVPDAIWPSDDEWGIPRLDLRKQADALEYPWNQWRKEKQSKALVGTMMFYTDDFRFKYIYDKPDVLFRTGCTSAIEPNFTSDARAPRAVTLFDVYRKRWIARYWQSKGIRIWCDVNVMPEALELNFLGVPKGWRAFSTRSHDDLPRLRLQHEAVKAHVGTDDFQFLVWGTGEKCRRECSERSWQFIDISVLFRSA